MRLSQNRNILRQPHRGVQYTSKEFTQLLDKYGVIRSNSRKENCWDNAVAESFFKTLKSELNSEIKNKSTQIIRDKVFQWIECWYNKKRRHSALGYLNIEEFWTQYFENENLIRAS